MHAIQNMINIRDIICILLFLKIFPIDKMEYKYIFVVEEERVY